MWQNASKIVGTQCGAPVSQWEVYHCMSWLWNSFTSSLWRHNVVTATSPVPLRSQSHLFVAQTESPFFQKSKENPLWIFNSKIERKSTTDIQLKSYLTHPKLGIKPRQLVESSQDSCLALSCESMLCLTKTGAEIWFQLKVTNIVFYMSGCWKAPWRVIRLHQALGNVAKVCIISRLVMHFYRNNVAIFQGRTLAFF